MNSSSYSRWKERMFHALYPPHAAMGLAAVTEGSRWLQSSGDPSAVPEHCLMLSRAGLPGFGKGYVSEL